MRKNWIKKDNYVWELRNKNNYGGRKGKSKPVKNCKEYNCRVWIRRLMLENNWNKLEIIRCKLREIKRIKLRWNIKDKKLGIEISVIINYQEPEITI